MIKFSKKKQLKIMLEVKSILAAQPTPNMKIVLAFSYQMTFHPHFKASYFQWTTLCQFTSNTKLGTISVRESLLYCQSQFAQILKRTKKSKLTLYWISLKMKSHSAFQWKMTAITIRKFLFQINSYLKQFHDQVLWAKNSSES
jgi:hypothetical protein